MTIRARGYYAAGPWVVADYGGEQEPEGLFAVTGDNAQVVVDVWNALTARAEAAEAERDALREQLEEKVKRIWKVREICAEAFPVYNTGQCVLVAPVLRALDGGDDHA